MRRAGLISSASGGEASQIEQRETYNEAETQDIRQRAEVGRNFEQEVGRERAET